MGILGKLFNRNKNKSEDEGVEITVSTPQPSVEKHEPIPVELITDKIRTRSVVAAVRRNGESPYSDLGVAVVDIHGYPDQVDTIVIRYRDVSLLPRIKNLIHRYRRVAATSTISRWIEMEIFVNVDAVRTNDPRLKAINGVAWRRIVYEHADDGSPLTATTRFPDCILLCVVRMDTADMPFNNEIPTLDMIIREGDR